MPREREQTEPLALGFKSRNVELIDVTPQLAPEVAKFREQSRLVPAMGTGMQNAGSPYAPPMLIRSLRDGAIVGLIENHALAGGVAVIVVYVDEAARPGFAVQAVALYVSALFDAGARLVGADVLSFNKAIIGIMEKCRWPPQARLREHVYTAGRLWDVIVYSFDRDGWLQALGRYVPRSAGGYNWPVFFGRTQSADTAD